MTLASSFPYNLIKNVYFLATFILINPVCLLTIKISGSQCLGTGMTASLTTVIPLLVSGI
ncbi:hypothetical protein [Wolbachia endosymbiont (group A) of Scambus nigricans]|uniref:hypothetical protein n=1 Tax=Wolbachia endosymbiont (group A) of Scambus nigricans TaxID=2954055 RepID=UPI00397E46C1